MATRRILTRAASVEAAADLNDTQTSHSVWQALPIKGVVQTWGDEVYFAIPLTLAQENSQAIVEIGDLGYWPPGKAFCIFFGPTPASEGDEIRPASPVNVFGRIAGDPTVFGRVAAGTEITVEKDVDS